MNTVLKSHFKFSATQRKGIFLLFLLMVLLQLIYFFSDFSGAEAPAEEEKKWMAMQLRIDSLKQMQPHHPKIYPFNPNFITDFKGYRLGMSTVQIDRLLRFRRSNKYVNSAAEFQEITKISDSLLAAISPYFKFPDWINSKKDAKKYHPVRDFNDRVAKSDINKATREDLIKVYGIGPALSERILKEKDRLGGFVSMEQMAYIWGLSPEVIANLQKRFGVLTAPDINRININNAPVKELSQFPFFRYALAKEIVTYRSMNGPIRSAEDLIKINGFPVEKVKIIALYLEF